MPNFRRDVAVYCPAHHESCRMTTHQLLLVPSDPRAVIDHGRMLTALHSIGLIDGPMPQGGEHFRPGENFLQLIIFLGCSPVVSLGEAGATADICHVELPQPSAQPVALVGNNLKKPRCSKCRYTLEDATGIVAAWRALPQDYQLPCPGCGTHLDIAAINWRQSAGFGRSLLRIWGIFEGEAVPSDELLATLKAASGHDWSYFYLSLDN